MRRNGIFFRDKRIDYQGQFWIVTGLITPHGLELHEIHGDVSNIEVLTSAMTEFVNSRLRYRRYATSHQRPEKPDAERMRH